jgi:hypothetical protein
MSAASTPGICRMRSTNCWNAMRIVEGTVIEGESGPKRNRRLAP